MWGWIVWGYMALMTALYAGAGFIASNTSSGPLKLEVGAAREFKLLRVTEDQLRFSLEFETPQGPRPDALGVWETVDNPMSTGRTVFRRPGAVIRIVASAPDAQRVDYRALPVSSRTATAAWRGMTSTPPLAPGVWRYLQTGDEPHVHLPIGVTAVRFEVAEVESPLAGELAKLIVEPPLAFKGCMPKACWLWWWFLWPFVAGLLALWAVFMVWLRWRRPSAAAR